MTNLTGVKGAASCGIALVTALVLAGCGGGTAGGSAAESQRAASKAEPGAAGGAGGIAGGKAAGAAPQGSTRDGGDTRTVALPPAALEGRAVIYTATLRVRTRDVENAALRAERIVTAAGGYVHDERTTTDPRRRAKATATLTFKVPADAYRGVLDDLGSRLGTRRHLEQQAQDVTQEVADVDARLRSARASLDRLRQLLAQAKTIGEVLSVEQQISQREAELESLEARQRALADATQYATVTLKLTAPAAAKKDQRDAGFLAGLAAGWRAFGETLGWVATAVGALLPFLVTLGVLGFAAWRLRATLRRRRAAPAPPTS